MIIHQTYGVDSEGPEVRLHVGNAHLPMTWDVAIRLAARLRVAIRDAQEYQGASRALAEPNPGDMSVGKRVVNVHKADYGEAMHHKVGTIGPHVVIWLKNGKLEMPPEIARNISQWLNQEGRKVQGEFAPRLSMSFHVAKLTDGNAKELEVERRRDGTATFH